METKYNEHVNTMLNHVDKYSWETYCMGLVDVQADAYAEGENEREALIKYAIKMLEEM